MQFYGVEWSLEDWNELNAMEKNELECSGLDYCIK